jgi:excisionase family DNA binding protein
MTEFNLTLYEACEYLNRSKKTISRLIRKGKLHPKRVKSQQGTLAYRFNKADLDKLKKALGAEPTDETGQDRHAPKTPATALKRRDRADETGQDKSFTGIFNDIVETLKDQLKAKDRQIDQLIERDRETNILLKGLQDRLMLAEKNPIEQAGQSKKGDKRKPIIIISVIAGVILIIVALHLLNILRF